MEKKLFDDLQKSIRQMKEIQSGKLAPGRIRVHSPGNEVSQVRRQLNLTQAELAELLGTPVSTLRGWEQGRRRPHKTARILIRLASKRPKEVLEIARSED